MNTNSRFNNGATAAAATAAIVVIFPLVVAVLRAFMCVCTRQSKDRSGHKILKQAKLGQFSTYSIETGQYVHKNYTYNMIRPLDCTDLPSVRLKKSVCV